MSITGKVRRTLEHKLEGLARSGALGESWPTATAWTVERPKRPEHGDLSTNVAMALAKGAGKPPRAIAEALVKALEGDDVIKRSEVAGPGFVNLRLHTGVFHEELSDILSVGRGYGRAPAATGERINLEFVSANPTGPITVAAARNAILGDSLGRVLEANGARVTREYYVNDFGNQVRLFAESVQARAEGKEVPKDGYQGAYVDDLAKLLGDRDPDEPIERAAIAAMLVGIRRSLSLLGVNHDVWTSEESLHRWGKVKSALAQLAKGGFLEEKDGALFFVGKGAEAEDKDRVVRKSDGTTAYFASDIAYLADKMGRGYDRALIVLGIDHHGYVARNRNAFEALGFSPDRFEVLLYNFVYIFRDGVAVAMGKRSGLFVTSDEVIEEIDQAAGRVGAGKDALRFMYLTRGANVKVDFDLDLAKKNTLDNPVFYVQYGHARLCSILGKAAEIGIKPPSSLTPDEWKSLVHPDELLVTLRLSELPELIASAAETREPHKVAFYLQTLAGEFQSYFTRLKTDPILPRDSDRASADWEARWDMKKTMARLAWVQATRIVYRTALDLLGVDAPERMDRPEEDGA